MENKLGEGDAASPPLEADLGLSIDMLDVDRLRAWSRNIEDYGSDLTHWCSTLFIVGKLKEMADNLETAICDIGKLRKLAAGDAAETPLPSLDKLDKLLDELVRQATGSTRRVVDGMEWYTIAKDNLIILIREAQGSASPPPQDGKK